jgi:hypothetical protein
VKKVTAASPSAGDRFGISVSLDDGVLLVGASVAVHGTTIAIGGDSEGTMTVSAYVFERDFGGSGNWGEAKILTGSDTARDRFGVSVAIEDSHFRRLQPRRGGLR